MQPTAGDDDIERLYRRLKAYGRLVRHDRRLTGPRVDTVTVRSPLCGSELTLDAVIAAERVQQLGWAVRACSLGQATTGIVVAHQGELQAREVRAIGAQLESILKGEARTSDWPELQIFAFAQDIPVRHGSALLPFRALEQLFERARRRHAHA